MGQIIGSFPVLIISDPCHPREPDWYSISCVSIYWTLLLLLSHTGAFCRNKIQVRMYIFVRREGFPMAQPSWEGIFAASDRAPRSQWREWNSSANFYQLLMIIKQGKARSICDGNFAQTESQISYLGQVVTSWKKVTVFFFELFKCISMSVRYVLFLCNTLFKLESVNSYFGMKKLSL